MAYICPTSLRQGGERIIGALLWHDRGAKHVLYKRAMEILEFVGIPEKAEHLAGELSYGQQKLLALACCLAFDADLLLLDEPVAGVSPALIEKTLGLLQELHQQNKTILLIEHNIDAAVNISERIIAMDEGIVIADGTPENVLRSATVIESYLS